MNLKNINLFWVFSFSLVLTIGYYYLILYIFGVPLNTSFYSSIVEFVKIISGISMFFFSFRITKEKVQGLLAWSGIFFALSGLYRVTSLFYFNFVSNFPAIFFLAQNVFLGISALLLLFAFDEVVR